MLLRSDSYADANDWDEPVDAFTKSLRNSSLDEVVHLVHGALPVPDGRWSEYIRLVSYTELDRVSELLRSTVPNALEPVYTPTRQSRPHVSVKSREQPNGVDDRQGQQKNSEMSQGSIVDELVAVIPGEDREK